MFPFPQPRHMPCSECGASLARDEREHHVCDGRRRLDFAVFQLRGEVGKFDEQFIAFLGTPRGRFEAWYASLHR